MTVIDSDTHVVEDAMIWDYVSKTDAAYKPVPMTADEDSIWPTPRADASFG